MKNSACSLSKQILWENKACIKFKAPYKWLITHFGQSVSDPIVQMSKTSMAKSFRGFVSGVAFSGSMKLAWRMRAKAAMAKRSLPRAVRVWSSNGQDSRTRRTVLSSCLIRVHSLSRLKATDSSLKLASFSHSKFWKTKNNKFSINSYLNCTLCLEYTANSAFQLFTSLCPAPHNHVCLWQIHN